jgi:hypothetical protein
VRIEGAHGLFINAPNSSLARAHCDTSTSCQRRASFFIDFVRFRFCRPYVENPPSRVIEDEKYASFFFKKRIVIRLFKM